jgi:hypothetical protein
MEPSKASLPFHIHQVTRGDIITSHALRQAHGLFVNDSINLACARRLTVTGIITHDGLTGDEDHPDSGKVAGEDHRRKHDHYFPR